MDYKAVIVAAGQGRRMGTPVNKVLLPLGDAPVIVHTLRVFDRDPDCSGIVLVVNHSEKRTMLDLLDRYAIEKVITLVDGGNERKDSVHNGLMQLAGEEGIVLIHDGARPFVNSDRITAVTRAASQSGAAILAVPVKDTIKQVSGKKIEKTLDRSSLWAAQTPQAFRLSIIMAAHRAGKVMNLEATDDAALVELSGHPVEIVKGSYRNIKLTTPEDLVIAEKFLREEEKTDARGPRI